MGSRSSVCRYARVGYGMEASSRVSARRGSSCSSGALIALIAEIGPSWRSAALRLACRVMRWVWGFLIALACWAGSALAWAQPRSLHYRELAVTASLDEDGRLHVEE